jgi:D-threo-aldose 1-dehydrogenase
MAAPSRALTPRSVQGFRPPRFGLGGSHLGEPPGPDGDLTAVATVDAAYQAGIRFFDTAPSYGDSERRLGTALRRRPRSEFLISTRVSPGQDVRESLEASGERLGLAVDLVLAEDEAALAELRRTKTVKAIGVTAADWEHLDRMVRDHDLDCVLLAGQYSLLDQSAAPLLDRCLARGVAVIVSGVLTPQVLQAEKSSDPTAIKARRISAVCERYGVSLPQAALAFPSRHSAVTSVLIAASRAAEIRADVALVRQPVPVQLWRDPELLRLLS